MDTVARAKAKLQASGVSISEPLISELEAEWNAPAVRTGRLVFFLKESDSGQPVPVFVVNGKRGATSPFSLVKKGSQFEVRERGAKFADVFFTPRPKFYDRVTTSGLAMGKVSVIVGPGHMRSVTDQRCVYHQRGTPCKFCAIQTWWGDKIDKNPLQIAETVEAGVEEGVTEHLSLTTGTLDSEGKGLGNLVETAKLIRERVAIPVMIEFEPFEDYALLESLLREAKEAGVTTVSCNIECFDESIREEVMPSKGRIPVAAYVKTWEKCLEIFGRGDVFTVAVAGVGEDDDAMLRGVEMAASHGVMTFIVPHSPAIGAAYQDMEPPSAERVLRLYEEAIRIYEKNGLDVSRSQAGCVRGGGFSAIKDVARFGI